MKKWFIKGTAILIVVMLIGGIPCNGQAASFSDVASDSWYYPAVMRMASMGIINGYPEQRFAPLEPMTVGQFVTVVARCCALIPIPEEERRSSHWASGFCEAALNRGWFTTEEIPASGETYDNAITKKLATMILVKAIVPPIQVDGSQWIDFIADKHVADMPYFPYIYKGYESGVVVGDEEGMFYPNATLTRAEACALLDRAITLYGTPVSLTATKDRVICSNGDEIPSMPTVDGGIESVSTEGGGAKESQWGVLWGAAELTQSYEIPWEYAEAYADVLLTREGFRKVEERQGVSIQLSRTAINDIATVTVFLEQIGGQCVVRTSLYRDVPQIYLWGIDSFLTTISGALGMQQLTHVERYPDGIVRHYLLKADTARRDMDTYVDTLEREHGFWIEYQGEPTESIAIEAPYVVCSGASGQGLQIFLSNAANENGMVECVVYVYY